MVFPFIFRGALDTRSSKINDEMKMAAALALSEIAQLDVPEEVSTHYAGRHFKFGREYIIPTPFDPRLITTIPVAVAKAAIETGVATIKITDWEAYKVSLQKRIEHTEYKL